MRKKLIILISILAVLTACTGCKNANNQDQNSKQTSSVNSNSILESTTNTLPTTKQATTKPRTDDDLLFSQITVGDDTFKIPCKLQDFFDKGYELNKNDLTYEYDTVDKQLNKVLTHTENNDILSLKKGDINLYVAVYNGENLTGSRENIKCKDSFVWDIATDPTKKYNGTPVFLSNGLSIGTDIDNIGITDISWHDTDGYVKSKSKLYTLKIFKRNNKVVGLGIAYNFDYDY